MTGYSLTDPDRFIVEKTTERVPDAERPRIVAIHEKQIESLEQRRVDIIRELQSVDRALAMRRAAIAALQPTGVT